MVFLRIFDVMSWTVGAAALVPAVLHDTHEHSTDNDEQLAQRVTRGDHAAFTLLVQRHHLRLYRLAYRYLFNQAAAEDVVQQCYVKYWQRPEAWRGEKGVKFTSWFSRVVINACLDHHRREKMQPLEASTQQDWEKQQAQWQQQDDEQAMQYEAQQHALMQAIKHLPDRQAMAVNLVYYEQYSYQQVAEAMNISVSALQSLVLRAKHALRQALHEK